MHWTNAWEAQYSAEPPPGEGRAEKDRAAGRADESALQRAEEAELTGRAEELVVVEAFAESEVYYDTPFTHALPGQSPVVAVPNDV